MRSYRIMLDGLFVTKISDGQTVELDASAGRHTLQARIDWQKTALIEFTAGNEQIVFDVYNKARGLKVMLSPFYGLIPGGYIGLSISRGAAK